MEEIRSSGMSDAVELPRAAIEAGLIARAKLWTHMTAEREIMTEALAAAVRDPAGEPCPVYWPARWTHDDCGFCGGSGRVFVLRDEG